MLMPVMSGEHQGGDTVACCSVDVTLRLEQFPGDLLEMV